MLLTLPVVSSHHWFHHDHPKQSLTAEAAQPTRPRVRHSAAGSTLEPGATLQRSAKTTRDWRCRSRPHVGSSSAQLWVPRHLIFGQRLPLMQWIKHIMDILWTHFGHTLDAFTSLCSWVFRSDTESEALIMFCRCFRSFAALCVGTCRIFLRGC